MFNNAVYSVCEEQLDFEDENSKFWEYLIPFIRFWGVFTAIVISGVGVDIAMHHHGIGIFYIICSITVFFLEITWIITIFVQVCVRNEHHCCFVCWNKILWFRLWKKSILYGIIALILFIKPSRLWLSTAAGFQLCLLSAFYLLLTFRSQKQANISPRLLNSHSPSQEDDKYDDISEDVLDDTLPIPINENMSTLENDTIIEL